MGTRDGRVARLPLDQFPAHLRRRADYLVKRLVGLENIAAACRVTVDEIVTWHLEHEFPLHRQGKRWVTTEQKIEGWLKARLQAERDARGHAGTSPAS